MQREKFEAACGKLQDMVRQQEREKSIKLSLDIARDSTIDPVRLQQCMQLFTAPLGNSGGGAGPSGGGASGGGASGGGASGADE